MDKSSKTTTVWVPVNEGAFNEKRAKSLAEVRAAMAHANALKNAWNTAFIADARKAGKVPAGHTLAVAHGSKWGKVTLSVAVVPEKAKGEKAATLPENAFSF